jgi:hypothetical protein
MAGARRIKNIRPKQSFRENGARVIEARLSEFLSWRAALTDPSEVTDLHNMRIAAKRLRYAFELFVLCFPDVRESLDQLAEMQESLGTIHDLDVLAEMLRERLHTLDVAVNEEAVKAVADAESRTQRSNRLRAVLNASARDRRRLGLTGLLAEKVGERQACYEEFRLRWGGPGLDLLAETVLGAIGTSPDLTA